MTSFKQSFIENLLAEAELPAGYKNPTPRATFQLNNIVLVRPDEDTLEEMRDYFEGLQPKKYYRYFNKVGKVIGYKAGTMSAKFAVEFSDDTIGSFNTAHLQGPFASVQAAETASKTDNNNFAPELFSKFVPRDEIIPTNKPLEDCFKEIFVTQSIGFKWLDNPVIINTSNNEQLVVIAHKPRSVKPDEDELKYRSWENHLPDELKSSFLFFKVFNNISGGFIPHTNFTENIWTVRMPLSNSRSGYYMQLPTFTNSNYAIRLASENQDYQASLCFSTMPINKSFEKHLKLCVSNFEKAEKLPTLTSFEEYFDTILHNVVKRDGKKIIIADRIADREVHIALQYMPAKFDLSKYKIEGSCYVETNKRFFNFPKEVTNNFRLMGNEMKLKNLIGLPKIGGQCVLVLCSLESLEGCPLEVDSDFKLKFLHGKLSNLKFLPKHIKGDCDISATVESFEGGDDCIIDGKLIVTEGCKQLDGLPKAGEYLIGVPQREIDDYFKFKELKQKLPELEGIF